MARWEAFLLGVVERTTEFLPIFSTGHLTMVEFFLGKDIADVGVVAFMAVIQIGAILTAVVYFWSDIWRIAKAWLSGPISKEKRLTPDYHFGWAIILGSIPIAVVGLALKDFIEIGLRLMWFVAGGLVFWSMVPFGADRLFAKGHVGMSRDSVTTIPQAFAIGLVQCFSLVSGASRSGVTISAGLFLGLDRVKATRLSLSLGILALVAADVLEGISNFGTIGKTVGWGSTAIGMIVSFVVDYLSIAWLLKSVFKHSSNAFTIYRLVVGGPIACCLLAGIIPVVQPVSVVIVFTIQERGLL